MPLQGSEKAARYGIGASSSTRKARASFPKVCPAEGFSGRELSSEQYSSDDWRPYLNRVSPLAELTAGVGMSDATGLQTLENLDELD
jgi:hypothetical protein